MTIDQSDRPTPGAVRRLAADPASRRRFLRMAGGAGAATALSALIAGCGQSSDDERDTEGATSTDAKGAQGSKAKGDLEIVNYALMLEYVEVAFYDKVLEAALLDGPALEAVKSFAEHEREHVDALTAAAENLGGKPVKKPKTRFELGDKMAVLKLAATVENLGASAYLGQAAMIEDEEILAAALSIHSVEARHAAALNILTGETPTVDGSGFAKPATMAEVLKTVQPFIVA